MIRIQGGCAFACYDLKMTFYSYQVYQNTKYSDFTFANIIWQSFDVTSTYFTGKI